MNKVIKVALAAAAIVAAGLSLAGCSGAKALTPAEAKTAYRAIAKASCDNAQTVGEVETDGTYTAIMVPRAMAYQNYSAAYFQKPSKYDLIYEASAFNACSDWFTFSTAADAKKPDGISVTFDPATGAYVTKQDLGQFGVFKTRMTVKDGLIDSALNLADKKAKVVTVQYGNLTNDQLAILKKSVDDLMASQK